MPDSEMFKVVLQGGSFALLAFIVVGCMRYAPRILEAIKNLSDGHVKAVDSINAANKENVESINSSHKEAVDKMAESHTLSVALMVKDCREERRELVQRLINEKHA